MRASGILLPVSSLPSKYGIGCFSKSAFEWIDFLQESGQTFWQILPLGPTSYGDSPYQSFSTFAGNPYFISLEELIAEGLLNVKQRTWALIRPMWIMKSSMRTEIRCYIKLMKTAKNGKMQTS